MKERKIEREKKRENKSASAFIDKMMSKKNDGRIGNKEKGVEHTSVLVLMPYILKRDWEIKQNYT